jgi:1,4-alpha-glucan branching enzyme
VQFVVLAPSANAVSLVGDFNDWDEGATPMAPMESDGLWSVTVPLAPGRYRYSFLVDGVTWVPDPAAPRSMDDDYGRPNSVVTVGGS